MEPDFSGYATKAGIKCADGRTILPGAFQHQDKMQVPLVWQHTHNDVKLVLGHVILEHRADGMYAYGYFNESENGKAAREAVKHKDIRAMSIYANSLDETLSKQVKHGMIIETSLVMKGANSGALIDYINLRHADGSIDTLEDEAIIFTGLEFEHDGTKPDNPPETGTPETPKEIFDNMSDAEKEVLVYMVTQALEAQPPAAAAQHDDQKNADPSLAHTKETTMPGTKNLFDQEKPVESGDEKVLTHSAMVGIFEAVKENKGASLKEAVDEYVIKHGITNLEVLFPEAKALTNTPEWDKRRTDWVDGVLSGVKKTPFAKVKTWTADLNFDNARAKGYIKDNFKKEEFFSLAARETSPQTIYKKQKLSRDDMIDLDFDAVPWMRGEMGLMLSEELAGAVLVGDGRAVDDEDKIREDKIRPVASDDDLYTTKTTVDITNLANEQLEFVDAITMARLDWRGTGTPTMYTSEEVLTTLLVARDQDDRRIWRNVQDLASELRVADIVVIDVMERRENLLAIIVNLADYTIGANKGGERTLFDDFDIDYNQYKYLIETRVSGALARLKSALAIYKVANGDTLATPTKPAFDKTTNTITIPTVTGVQYSIDGVNQTNGATVVITDNTYVDAKAKSGYYTKTSRNRWAFSVQDI